VRLKKKRRRRSKNIFEIYPYREDKWLHSIYIGDAAPIVGKDVLAMEYHQGHWEDGRQRQ
jgi:hypothetical protein